MTYNNCSKCSNNEEYQEFVPDKEYSVGEFFKIDKEVFKVVEDGRYPCESCDFSRKSVCEGMICSDCQRSNEDSVQFILYDTLEDNE